MNGDCNNTVQAKNMNKKVKACKTGVSKAT